jgi:hypothetical protein
MAGFEKAFLRGCRPKRALVGQHEAWSTTGCGHRIPNTEQVAQAHGEQVLWHAPCPPCQAE